MSTEDTQDEEPRHPYETEDSFHPLGEKWEDRMREELEDTEYDADLGMEMARDAQRLVAGEISEEEFYAEYHDDVEEEFEEDDRALFDDVDPADYDEIEDESVLESLADMDLEGDEASRREMMKKMGAGAAFLGYGAFATYDNQPEDGAPTNVSGIRPAGPDERENRWGMSSTSSAVTAVSRVSQAVSTRTGPRPGPTGCTSSTTTTRTPNRTTSSYGPASTVRTPRVRRSARSGHDTSVRKTESC